MRTEDQVRDEAKIILGFNDGEDISFFLNNIVFDPKRFIYFVFLLSLLLLEQGITQVLII